MFMHLLRIAIYTLCWSLLGCLLLMIIVNNRNNTDWLFYQMVFACAMAVLLVLILCIRFYRGPLIGDLLSMLPSRNMREGWVILAYVEQAVRMNAPLSPILDAAAKTERGRLASRLAHLRDLIDAGVDLSVAMEQGVPEVSWRAVRLIAAGERTGQLRTVLPRLLAEAEPPSTANNYDARFALAYIVMMLTAMTLAVALLAIFVEPKFWGIMRDFHQQIPPINLWVISVTQNVAPVIGLIALALLLFWFIYGLWVMIRRPHGAPRDVWALVASLGSLLPWFGQSQRDRSWADVCRVLSDSFAAGWPADAALNQAQQISLAPFVRSKVQNWKAHVQSGSPLAEAARGAALPGIFVGIISAAGDQTAAALDFLGRYYANRFSRVRILLRGAVVPAVVLFFALCVSAIALSIFMPLVSLINHMAPWVGSGQ
jgi:type II secretory pathway component PulF